MGWQDLRQGWRNLRREPGVTAVVVLSLGIGIALNVAVFSLVNEVLLRPPAVRAPDQLVRAYTSSRGGEGYESTSYADYQDLRAQSPSLSDLAAHCMAIAAYVPDGRAAEVVVGELVTGNYFEVLGVPAMLGRVIGEPDVTGLGADTVVVLGYDFWQKKLGGRPEAVGETIRLNGRRFTVIGVLPREFTGIFPGLEPTVYVPVTMAEVVEPAGQITAVPSPGDNRLDRRGYRFLWMIGRMKQPGQLAAVGAELDAAMVRLDSEYPQTNKELHVNVVGGNHVRLHPDVDAALGPTAAVLLVVMGVVLLVVCGNVANMLLARASRRRREVAVRAALGASRGRLIRQLLTENVLLAALGGVAGLAMGWAAMRLIAGFQPAALPLEITLDLPLDLRVMAFTLAVTGLTGLFFGLAPALVASRSDIMRQMRREDLRPRRVTLGHVLVSLQVALCLSLTVGAGLLARSVLAASEVPLGVPIQKLGLVATDLGMIEYPAEQVAELQQRLMDAARAVPGVTAVTWAERLPLDVNAMNTTLKIQGFNESADEGVGIDETSVAPGYFDTLQVPILEGRAIDERDQPDAARVVVVNRAFAQRYWPGESALDKRVWASSGREYQVVGVAADYKVRSVGEAPRPLVHFALTQVPNTYGNLVFRSERPAAGMVEAVRRAALQVEPSLVVMDAAPLVHRLQVNLFPVVMGSILLGGMSAFTVLLAAIGLYGLISYWVAARTREIGIRVALGARPIEVTGLVARRGLALVAAGLVLGTLIAIPLGRMLSGVLLGIGPGDPVTFIAGAMVLSLVSALANALPARRAVRVDPIVALRSE